LRTASNDADSWSICCDVSASTASARARMKSDTFSPLVLLGSPTKIYNNKQIQSALETPVDWWRGNDT